MPAYVTHPSEALRWARLLADDLRSPKDRAEIGRLTDLWAIERVVVRCRRPRNFADFPELSVRVRGALGRALQRLGGTSPVQSRRPPAFHFLYAPAGDLAPGLEIPKPMIVRAWTERDSLIAEASLFGMAAVFADEVAEALEAAIAGGIAVGPDRALRVPLDVENVVINRVDGLSFATGGGYASLYFRTPVAVRSGGYVHADPATIVRSILVRVAGLARWQGFELSADRRALHAIVEKLDIDDRGLIPANWQRHSSRQGPRAIPMAGWLGPLRLSGRLGPLAPFLAVAATCNTGSHAGLGLGWFDLTLA